MHPVIATNMSRKIKIALKAYSLIIGILFFGNFLGSWTLGKTEEKESVINSADTKLSYVAKNLQDLDVSVKEWNQDSLINIQKTVALLGYNSSHVMQRIDDYFSLVKQLNKGNQLMNKGFTNIKEVKEYYAGFLSLRDKYQF
jgi:hypothetical protein